MSSTSTPGLCTVQRSPGSHWWGNALWPAVCRPCAKNRSRVQGAVQCALVVWVDGLVVSDVPRMTGLHCHLSGIGDGTPRPEASRGRRGMHRHGREGTESCAAASRRRLGSDHGQRGLRPRVRAGCCAASARGRRGSSIGPVAPWKAGIRPSRRTPDWAPVTRASTPAWPWRLGAHNGSLERQSVMIERRTTTPDPARCPAVAGRMRRWRWSGPRRLINNDGHAEPAVSRFDQARRSGRAWRGVPHRIGGSFGKPLQGLPEPSRRYVRTEDSAAALHRACLRWQLLRLANYCVSNSGISLIDE